MICFLVGCDLLPGGDNPGNLNNDVTITFYDGLTRSDRMRYGVRMVSPPFYVKFSATAKRLEDNICVYKIMSSDLDSKLLYDDERKTTWELKIDGGKLFVLPSVLVSTSTLSTIHRMQL